MKEFKLIQIIISFFLLCTSVAFAKSPSSAQKKLQDLALQDWAGSINLAKTPTEFLKKYQSRYSPEDLQFFQKLIDEKSWVEMPVASIDQQELVLKLPSKEVRLEIVDYFKSEYRIKGYPIDWSLHKTHPAQIRYLQRVIQSRSAALNFWEILFEMQTAEASATCNVLIKSGCREISAATAIWVAQEIASDSPIKHCADIYYHNKNNATTITCLEKYKGSPNLEAMKELAEVFVLDPLAELELDCSARNGPVITINGVNLPKVGTAKAASSYNIPVEVNKDFKFNKVPSLALKCCQSEGDQLAGTCESFVNSHLGNPQKRSEKLNKENYRVKGKPVPSGKDLKGAR